MEKFKIYTIPLTKYGSLEPLGTKRKFWFEEDGESKLFKSGRINTGENWVEVVVSELCGLLNIPHANYHFAEWNNMEGTITENFVPKNGHLVHGNELLAFTYKFIDPSIEYPIKDKLKIKEYKLQLIIHLMKNNEKLQLPIDYQNGDLNAAFDIFISYIMLDCLISNPDRHHENWSLIIYESQVYLSPTYDHASGLGCREPDHKKKQRLESKDKGFQVKTFVKKAKTPFHDIHEDNKNLTTIKAFEMCAEAKKDSGLYWLEKLEQLDLNKIKEIFDRIPESLISDISIDFAMKILEENKARLMDIKRALINE